MDLQYLLLVRFKMCCLNMFFFFCLFCIVCSEIRVENIFL